MKDFARKFYKSKEWQKLRKLALIRDNYMCFCGQPAKIVHHKVEITQENIYKSDVVLNLDNLISVCKKCHEEIHYGIGIKRNTQKGYMFDETGNIIEVLKE